MATQKNVLITRQSHPCPLFGLPKELSGTVLPTYEDVVCEKVKKIPRLEIKSMYDQRTTRMRSISGVNEKETGNLTKREERKQKQLSRERKNAFFDNVDLNCETKNSSYGISHEEEVDNKEFNALLFHLNGETADPVLFSGNIGKELSDCEKLPVVNSGKIDSPNVTLAKTNNTY
ncbi:hypothetical protein ILUMI_22983 [Ignelater luminosus]|uniref:Uncharacterized protein n=1 Tax=Ignelater luminosus TaxID=2038154 RepID=A0A8K0G2C4_IGNLU|nr:hypothetical protein ILUMI_22983 [Ignelater luminosus]